MRWQLAVFVVVASACLGWTQAGGGKTDQDAMQGVWNIVGGEMKGMALTPEMVKTMEGQLTVKGDTMHWKTKAEDDMATFKLDTAKKPRQIDITDKKDGKVMKGIYEINGDDFKVCLDPDGKDRPTEFKTKADGNAGLLVFKRAKK